MAMDSFSAALDSLVLKRGEAGKTERGMGIGVNIGRGAEENVFYKRGEKRKIVLREKEDKYRKSQRKDGVGETDRGHSYQK